jgi:hypothetical protein
MGVFGGEREGGDNYPDELPDLEYRVFEVTPSKSSDA